MKSMNVRLLILSLLLSVPASVQAKTLHFEITSSPPDAFKLLGGLSGHITTAALTGSFSITTEPGQAARLHDFNLRLLNAMENFELAPSVPEEYEGKPVEDFLPVDLESFPAIQSEPHHGSQFIFADLTIHDPNGPIPGNPGASMRVDILGDTAQVQLLAKITPDGLMDGPTLIFKSVTAAVIPEPASLLLAPACFFAIAAVRSHK